MRSEAAKVGVSVVKTEIMVERSRDEMLRLLHCD